MLHGVDALEVIVQFAVTGAIGPLRCDASLHEIAKCLGTPYALGPVSNRRRWPHRFGYGDVELCVCRCRRVQSIDVRAWLEGMELELPHPEPGAAMVRSAGRLTYSQVMTGLQAVGCVMEPLLRQPPGQMAVRAARTGVEFVFTTSASAEPLLDKAGSWVAAHDCPPIRTGTPDDGFGVAVQR